METLSGSPARAMLPDDRKVLRAILDACASHVVVTDLDGTILFSNRSWDRFATENRCSTETWTGLNYLDVCRQSIKAGDVSAALALTGIQELIDGKRRSFTLEYPCHSAEEQRWFMLTVVVLSDFIAPERSGRERHNNCSLLAFFHDRLTSNSELRKARERLALATDAGKIGVWELELAKQILLWDHWMYKIHGVAPGKFEGTLEAWYELLHPDDRERFAVDLNHTITTASPLHVECRIQRPDGGIRHVSLKAQPAWDKDGEVSRLTGVVFDISDLRRAESHILDMAFKDPLTKLPNRVLLMDRLEQAMRVTRRGQSCGALFFIDLDRFKQVNDNSGHAMGDQLLQSVAERLQNTMRSEDTLSRIGGDEYILLTPELARDPYVAGQQAKLLATKITNALSEPFDLDGSVANISCSIGIALLDGQAGGAEALLRQSDLAMYKAKRKGRNTFHFYDSALQAETSRRQMLEAGLHVALQKTDQLRLVYQPQVESDGAIVSAEALVRWDHPTLGAVMPEEFIPIAEDIGLIVELGSWIFDQVCAQVSEWTQSDPLRLVKVAVNISAHQLKQSDCLQTILQSMNKWAIDPSRLELELTESVLLEDTDIAIANLIQMQSAGIQLVLDDFGTGYSSLGYLKRLPLSTFKIDRSFVRDIITDPNDAAIAQTILDLARVLGMKVIAEGVENSSQLEFLSKIGCRCFQGFLFHPPLAVREFEAVLGHPA